jgi:uncharacterized Zn-binding protein involved in type VI secretion
LYSPPTATVSSHVNVNGMGVARDGAAEAAGVNVTVV